MDNLVKFIDDFLKKPLKRRDFLKAGSLGTVSALTPTCFPGDAISKIYLTKDGEETKKFYPEDEIGVHAVINPNILPITFAIGSLEYPGSTEDLELRAKLLFQGTTEHSWYTKVPDKTGNGTVSIFATSGLIHETEQASFEVIEQYNVAVDYAKSLGITDQQTLDYISNLGKDGVLDNNETTAIDITAYMNDNNLGFPSVLANSMTDGTITNDDLINILSDSNVRFVKQGELNGNGIYGFPSIEPLIPQRQQEEHEWMNKEYPEHPDAEHYPMSLEDTIEYWVKENEIHQWFPGELGRYQMIKNSGGGYLYENGYSQICGDISRAMHPASFFQLQKDFPDQGYTTLEIADLGTITPDEITHVDVAAWDPNLNKWVVMSTTSAFVDEMTDGIYGPYDRHTTTWAVDKFLEQTNNNYQDGKGSFIGDLSTGLHIQSYKHNGATLSHITLPEQTWRDVAEDMMLNGYNNLAKEFAMLTDSMKEGKLISNLSSSYDNEYNGMHGIVTLKNNKLIPYFVDKNTFDEMRNNGTGNEPIIP